MADRYGAASPARRRLVIAVSGVVGLVALGWLAWAAWFQSTPDVQSSLRTFDVVDSPPVRPRWRLHLRDDDVKASCLVRATAADHSVVGELNFTVTGVSGSTRPRRDPAHRARGHVRRGRRLHHRGPVAAPLRRD